jgi:hypothetical protein
VEALENAPSNGLTRQDVRKMLEEESAKLREEIVERKKKCISERNDIHRQLHEIYNNPAQNFQATTSHNDGLHRKRS